MQTATNLQASQALQAASMLGQRPYGACPNSHYEGCALIVTPFIPSVIHSVQKPAKTGLAGQYPARPLNGRLPDSL